MFLINPDGIKTQDCWSPDPKAVRYGGGMWLLAGVTVVAFDGRTPWTAASRAVAFLSEIFLLQSVAVVKHDYWYAASIFMWSASAPPFFPQGCVASIRARALNQQESVRVMMPSCFSWARASNKNTQPATHLTHARKEIHPLFLTLSRTHTSQHAAGFIYTALVGLILSKA